MHWGIYCFLKGAESLLVLSLNTECFVFDNDSLLDRFLLWLCHYFPYFPLAVASTYTVDTHLVRLC